MESTTLIIGASGQIGIELTMALREKRGPQAVIAADIRPTTETALLQGPYEVLDVLDKAGLEACISKYNVKEVYLLAALLSATAEKNPEFAWKLNMDGLFNVLDLAREGKISKLFWPSSIAVFGPTTPKEQTPQHTVMEPTTVYGISKLAGERWCAYYHERYGVDVRSIRYPGLIGYRSEPGGGTTDYAVDIFHKAIEHGAYTCFLSADTRLPMMMMEDAIRATIAIMEAPTESIKERGGYNIAGCSFTPEELATHIQSEMPEFRISYQPDFRQAIADSWPASIDDSAAARDWGWKSKYDTALLSTTMLREVDKKKAHKAVTHH
ncbi:MAG: NAD-dependent epimerase/dehydratase family protein [Flavobacteriales bacterium]|jgi:nucleoside-diphosphate-sugar epimerase